MDTDSSDLKFQPSPPMLYGTQNTIGFYPFLLNVSDRNSYVSITLEVNFTNQPPYFLANSNIIVLYLEVKFAEFYSQQILKEAFRDPDGDPISINLWVKNSSNQTEPLPDWMVYYQDNQTLNLYITSNTQVKFDEAQNKFYEEFKILIVASDPIGDNATVEMQVVAQHEIVKVALPVQEQLVAEIKSGRTSMLPEQDFTFQYSTQTFEFERSIIYRAYYRQVMAVNDGNGGLIYEWSERVQLQPNQVKGFWLRFDAGQRKFFGYPTKNDIMENQIELQADDGFSNSSAFFFINITNHVSDLLPPHHAHAPRRSGLPSLSATHTRRSIARVAAARPTHISHNLPFCCRGDTRNPT